MALVGDVGHRGVTVVLAALTPVALAVAGRAPLAGVLAFGALCVADAVLGGRLLEAGETAVFICIVGMLVLGIRADTRAFALGAIATVVLLTAASVLEGDDTSNLLTGIAWVCIVPVGIPGLLGRVLRGRNDLNRRLDEQARELERNRAEREQAAVLAERTRIRASSRTWSPTTSRSCSSRPRPPSARCPSTPSAPAGRSPPSRRPAARR